MLQRCPQSVASTWANTTLLCGNMWRCGTHATLLGGGHIILKNTHEPHFLGRFVQKGYCLSTLSPESAGHFIEPSTKRIAQKQRTQT